MRSNREWKSLTLFHRDSLFYLYDNIINDQGWVVPLYVCHTSFQRKQLNQMHGKIFVKKESDFMPHMILL
jgi:hypothetical protein